jgi:hypothetical protein
MLDLMEPAMIALLLTSALAQTPHGPCAIGATRMARPVTQFNTTSGTYPIKVHWDRSSDDAKALAVLAAAELAWAVQVDGLGFREPVLPDGAYPGEDGPELDFYLAPVGAGYAWAEPDNWVDSVPGDGYNSVSAHMVIDHNLPDDWIDSYVAHEFNHVLQFAYDFNEWTLPIWEATATAAQEWTLGPGQGAWDIDVPDFQGAPWINTLEGDGYYVFYELGGWAYTEYGAALWVMHLDQVVGTGDGTMGPALWEAASQEGLPNEPDAVDAFATAAGTDLGTALNGLARTRFLVADDWDDRGLPDAQYWDAGFKALATTLLASEMPVEHTFSPGLHPTGQGFVDVDLSDAAVPQPGEVSWMVASVHSAGGLESGLIALWWRSDGSVGEVQASGADATLELDLTDLTRVALGVSSLGATGWDGDDQIYDHGDHVLQLALETRTEDGTTTPPDTTATPGGTTGEPNAGKGEDGLGTPPAGCGCQQAQGTPSTLLILGVAGLVLRRKSTPGTATVAHL